MDLVQLADLWEENQETLKQHLGQSDRAEFDARWVLMPTVPYPRFNHVSRIRIDDDQVNELIVSARAFFRANRIPNCTLMVTPATQPSNLGHLLYRTGFMTETNPVMVWSGGDLPDAGPPGLRVVRAGPGQTELFWSLIRQIFFAGATAEMLAAGRRGVHVSDEIGAINYIAYLGDSPVGAGTLFQQGEMGGIYNMCTLPRFQHRGVATAVLKACISDALANGCSSVGLTPTAAGRPLYERMGFREVYQEIYFSQRIW